MCAFILKISNLSWKSSVHNQCPTEKDLIEDRKAKVACDGHFNDAMK